MVQLLGESSRVESTTRTKQGAGAGALAWPHMPFIVGAEAGPLATKDGQRGQQAMDGGVGRWDGERDGDTEQNKPTRPTKEKMKSSAFAHRTVRSGALGGLPVQREGTRPSEAGHQGAPGGKSEASAGPDT